MALKKDTVTEDLRIICQDSGINPDSTHGHKLMEKLVSYVTRQNHLAFNRGTQAAGEETTNDNEGDEPSE